MFRTVNEQIEAIHEMSRPASGLTTWIRSAMSGNPPDDGWYTRDPKTPSNSRTVKYYGPFKSMGMATFFYDMISNTRDSYQNGYGVDFSEDGLMKLKISDPNEYGEERNTVRVQALHPMKADVDRILKTASYESIVAMTDQYVGKYKY